ncbi:MAG: rRNA ((1939)-C(5))-methyltransferase RlmD [Oscillospiraceae bacterium]|nr:rRNA ((1939)-C(5))-methyltransferase RlmD [Oscillospiraceae bacterium]
MTPQLLKNSVHRAVISGYASDGAGVARIHDMVVFISGGIRNETVEVRIDHVGRNAAWGRVQKVISPSPSRLAPDCPHYGVCGGCQFRHMSYAEELEAKRARVEDALRRVGGLDIRVEHIAGGRDILRYRNKVQFPVGQGFDGVSVGFYRPRSHQVVDIPDCLLQPEAAARCRRAVKDWMERYSVPSYQEGTGKGLIRHLYIRFNSNGGILCCLFVNGKKLPHEEELIAVLRAAEPELLGIVLGVNTKQSNVILGETYRTLWGRDYLEDTLCGLTFRLSVPSFYQVNHAQTEVLYQKAIELAQLTGEETVLDLYCGIGTISLCLAQKAKQVIGAEVVPEAVEDAKQNAVRNGITNVRFLCADAGEAAKSLAAEGISPDVIVVDPPRKGISPQVIDAIAQMNPARLVYVSCDPATLARDAARLAEKGYSLSCATSVDMFPRTAHVETIIMMTKCGSEGKK